MFRRRAPIEDHVVDWVFQTWAWLLREFGGIEDLRSARLVLPTEDHFPIEADDEDEMAEEIFLLVRQHAGMLDWPCRLVKGEPGSDPHEAIRAALHSYRHSGAAGTFRHDGRKGVISYDPRLVAQPMQLVATFAHELGHYLLAGARNHPPGGPDAEEPATDVAAVFMGFGIFCANSAFVFQQYSDGVMAGWSASQQGYLGEDALSYALAIFAELLEIPDSEIKPHLKPNPRAYLRQSRRHLLRERAEDLADLRRL